jgi:hypothetical protein
MPAQYKSVKRRVLNQNYNPIDEDAMSRKPFELISGFAVYVVLSLLIAWSVKLHLPFVPSQVAEWLGRSHDPQSALVYFSLFSSAVMLALIHLGVEIPKAKFSVPEKLQPYLSGLPMWALGILLAVSLFGFWTVYPACQPPVTIEFEISSSKDRLHPSDTLNVHPGEAITVTAHSVNADATLHCKWEYAGSIFQTLGAQNDCQVSTRFGSPGSGFITVNVSEDFCSQSSIFSLRTIVNPP